MSRRHQQPSLPIVSVRPEPTAAAAAGCRPCSECPVPLSQQHQRVVALPSQSNPTVPRAGTVVLIWNQQLDELFVSIRTRSGQSASRAAAYRGIPAVLLRSPPCAWESNELPRRFRESAPVPRPSSSSPRPPSASAEPVVRVPSSSPRPPSATAEPVVRVPPPSPVPFVGFTRSPVSPVVARRRSPHRSPLALDQCLRGLRPVREGRM